MLNEEKREREKKIDRIKEQLNMGMKDGIYRVSSKKELK